MTKALDRQEARRKYDELGRLRTQLGKAIGVKSDAERKRRERAQDRVVWIPTLSPEDRAERERREADDALWLESYWSAFSRDEFYPLSPQQQQMVSDFRAALEHGGDRATAASRGEGKTTFAVALTLKEILRGNIKFVLLLGANAKNAEALLDTISRALGDNLELRKYYPEVCVPVAALERTAQRAGKQLVSGNRHDNNEPYEMACTDFHWTGDELIFPVVPGSPAAGAVVASYGLDSSVRGMKIRNLRPQLVLIDDPDTRDTQSNPAQAAKLLDKIDRDLAALGSQKRPVTRLVLCTIASTCCAAAQLTDRAAYPSFRGRRFRFLLKPPTAMSKWDDFVSLCKSGWRTDDDILAAPIPLEAHQFYLTNRDEMDAGADVANENRYDHRRRVDGTTVEVSALEHYYGLVAKLNPERVATEYDNDPADPAQAGDDGLCPSRIQQQVSGYDRRTIPPEAELLTMGIDVGKFLLHWVVVAWRKDGTSYVVDYGTQDVRGTVHGSDEGMEAGIAAAIRILVNEKKDKPYAKPDGTELPISMTLIDSGWGLTMKAVYAACREIGVPAQVGRQGVEPDVQPAKGKGDGAKDEGGRKAGPFANYQKRDWDHLPGDGWVRSKQRKDGVNLYIHNAGQWKDWGIQRWLTPIDKPGCRFIWGRFDEHERQHMRDHAQISYHLCANCYRDELVHGHTQRIWGERAGMNGDKDHWQDAQELADVAANIMGVRLEIGRNGREAKAVVKMVSLADMGK